MKYQILGTGCAKCGKLSDLTVEAAEELGLEYEIEKVTDITQIMSYGVMSTPALAIDGKVVLSGRLPTLQEMKDLLSK